MSSSFQRAETIDSDVVPPEGTTVDLTPTTFGGTFQHPCFWILVGVIGVITAQYLLKSSKE